MLHGDRADLALRIDIEEGVLIKLAGLGNRRVAKLDVQRVGIGEAANLRGSKLRSKKALWTVSPSGSRITREETPSPFAIQ